MPKTWAKAAGAAVCIVTVLAVALVRNGPTIAAPRPDLKPTAHWVFDTDSVIRKTVADRGGKITGTLLGTPVIVDSPIPHLYLSGPSDGVMMKEGVSADSPILAKDALSVVAWVRVDEPTEWGGFLGCFQDNGPEKNGFILGFNKSAFVFGLAASNPRAAKMTYLESKTPYVRGKWYHIAATSNLVRCGTRRAHHW
jgi:hypothetical protein